MKKDCKTCTVNSTNDTVETCKRPCYLRYSKQRKDRICELENKLNKYKQALEKIGKVLDKSCKQCQYEYLNEDYCSEGDCFKIKSILCEVLDA